MKFSQALEGFLIGKAAEGMSDQTITTYKKRLEKFCVWSQNKDIAQYKKQDVVDFLAWLKTNYTPQRNNGNTKPLASQTIHNIFISLASFFAWVKVEELGDNVVEKIKPPKTQQADINPYTEQEIKALLKAIKQKDIRGRKAQNVLRNETIFLVLLDTGMRIQEFCNLRVNDYDKREGSIKIINGKGNKSRIVYIGKRTQFNLWKYLETRGDILPSDFLFVNQRNKQFGQSQLRVWFYELGEKANVKNVHPHRFRYTFAIEYLRGGGDLFTLQKMLGHSDLNMVRRYAKVANLDVQAKHRIAGPVDRFFS